MATKAVMAVHSTCREIGFALTEKGEKMPEYVTKEQVKEELLSWARCINKPDRLVTEDALFVIDSMEPADVRRVIYCKDCRFAKGKTVDMWGNPAIECDTGELHEYEWFCASAQRRKDVQDKNGGDAT